MKVCCTCKISQEESGFCKNKNSKDKLSAQCRSCAKLYRNSHKQEKLNYPSFTMEYRRNYYEIKKDHINDKRKEYYQNDPEKYLDQSRKSHQKHRDERLEKQHIYYESNKEYFAEKNKRYRNENLDEILLKNRQRENFLDSFPVIKQSEINNLLNTYNHQCFYCHINVKRGINLHLDHKTPLSRGGKHFITNLVPACQNCNLRKGTKTAEEFLDRNK